MKLKKIISLGLFASLLLGSALLISACGTAKIDEQSSPTVSTNEDINSAINELIDQRVTTTNTTSTASTTTSTATSSAPLGEVKANINLDNELKDLDNTVKGADSKGFSDSDLNVN